MLTISHLTKTFGDKTAVDDLSLHIAPGEICGFIGHNGAGKTTTIKDRAQSFFNGSSVSDRAGFILIQIYCRASRERKSDSCCGCANSKS